MRRRGFGRKDKKIERCVILLLWTVTIIAAAVVVAIKIESGSKEFVNTNGGKEPTGVQVENKTDMGGQTQNGKNEGTSNKEVNEILGKLTREYVEQEYRKTTKNNRREEILTEIKSGIPVYSAVPVVDNEAVTTKCREKVKELISKNVLEETETFSGTCNTIVVNYDLYINGVTTSVVFWVVKDEELNGIKTRSEKAFPCVYDNRTGNELTLNDIVKETYLSIVKGRVADRLMNEIMPAFMKKATEEGIDASILFAKADPKNYLSAATAYNPEDYTSFYITNDEIVFCFEKNRLVEHEEFYYSCKLSEAKAFFKINIDDGTLLGPNIRQLDPNKKMVAFTFDDGPYTRIESKLADLLVKNNARATFFVYCNEEGDRKIFYESLVNLKDHGMEIASHTYSHISGFGNKVGDDPALFWSEIDKNSLKIAELVGYAPDYVRLPEGLFKTQKGYEYITKYSNLPIINWNVDSEDWSNKGRSDQATITKNQEKIFNNIIGKTVYGTEKLNDGSIILMHSLYDNTYETVEKLIPYLQANGYEIVTVSELFYYKGINATKGHVYKNASEE